MVAATPTFEHLAFPGCSHEEEARLLRRLELVEEGACLFAAGLLGVRVQTSWSLGRRWGVRWIASADTSLSAHVWVDVLSKRDLAGDRERPTPDQLVAAFRCGFLHALGRMLYSPNPLNARKGGTPDVDDPLESVVRRDHPRRRELAPRVRGLLGEPESRRVLLGLWEELEGGRTDGLLRRVFAGAERELASRRAARRDMATSHDPVTALVGRAAWHLAGETEVLEGDELPAALAARLDWVAATTDTEGARRLAETVVYDLLPVLLMAGEGSLLAQGTVLPGVPAQGDDPARMFARHPGIDDLAQFSMGTNRRAESGAPGTVVVSLPRVSGGEALFRVDRARARELPADDLNRRVVGQMVERYGPAAEAAFATYAAPLRRALGVNYERRRRGRYRTGTHVGIPNLRRYVLSDDVRLFQRLEAPENLSYYVHLLVDASYSMLEADKAAKALAVAYGFTAVLRELRVPVDVTLYSSGITELYDHRVDPLDRFFGGEFGYLVSGTLEMEAIAFARGRLGLRGDRRTVFIVITDGTPSVASLGAVGAESLIDYYRDTLVPWLERSGVELLAIGIDCEPEYHERAVCLTESWDTIDVLVGLLEEMVAEGDRRTQLLWT